MISRMLVGQQEVGIRIQGDKDRAYAKVESQIPAYRGFVFEEMCKQYLWQENLQGRLPIEFTDMGRWWGTGGKTGRRVID